MFRDIQKDIVQGCSDGCLGMFRSIMLRNVQIDS